jgi:hypothetical protein
VDKIPHIYIIEDFNDEQSTSSTSLYEGGQAITLEWQAGGELSENSHLEESNSSIQLVFTQSLPSDLSVLTVTGDNMVRRWNATAKNQTKQVNFTKITGITSGLLVDCGTGVGFVEMSSPLKCTYTDSGNYQVIIANPEILTGTLDICCNKNITAFR